MKAIPLKTLVERLIKRDFIKETDHIKLYFYDGPKFIATEATYSDICKTEVGNYPVLDSHLEIIKEQKLLTKVIKLKEDGNIEFFYSARSLKSLVCKRLKEIDIKSDANSSNYIFRFHIKKVDKKYLDSFIFSEGILHFSSYELFKKVGNTIMSVNNYIHAIDYIKQSKRILTRRYDIPYTDNYDAYLTAFLEYLFGCKISIEIDSELKVYIVSKVIEKPCQK